MFWIVLLPAGLPVGPGAVPTGRKNRGKLPHRSLKWTYGNSCRSCRSGRGPTGTLTKATPPNPKFAAHHHPRCAPLSGTSRCSARQFWLAEHRIRPYRGLRGTLTCSANFGLGLGSYSRHPHAGSRLPWRRSQASLAQVCFWEGDLHRKSASYALQWRRSPPIFHTCAKHPRHLRQTPQTPAPRIDTTCANYRASR